MIRLDDDDDTILSVFADAPEDYDIDPNDESVLYVDEPWFDPDENSAYYTLDEKIRTIYIAPGCVFYSRLIINRIMLPFADMESCLTHLVTCMTHP